MSTKNKFKITFCEICKKKKFTQLPFTEVKFDKYRKSALFLCRSCGMTPFFSNYKLSSNYKDDNRKLLLYEYYQDNSNREYSVKRSKSIELNYRKRISENLFWCKNLINNECSRLLDIGCGEGVLLQEAKKLNFEVEGIEPSYDQCKMHKINGLTVHQGLCEDYKDKFKNKFDIVTLTWVLDYFLYPKKNINIINNFLKEDGYLLIMKSTMLDVNLFKYRFGIPFPHQKNIEAIKPNLKTSISHPYYYTKKSLLMIMEICGFELVSEKSNYGLQPVFLFKKMKSKVNYKFNNNHIAVKLYFYFWFFRDLLYIPIFSKILDCINTFRSKR